MFRSDEHTPQFFMPSKLLKLTVDDIIPLKFHETNAKLVEIILKSKITMFIKKFLLMFIRYA